MQLLNSRSSALPLIAAVALAATAVSAQVAPPSLLQTRPQYVAYWGLTVPGTFGGETFGGGGGPNVNPNPPSPFDGGVIDADGYVVFRGRLTGGGVVATNERAIFRGRNVAELQMLIRSGDQAPGLPLGITLNTATGQGLGGSPRTSKNGVIMFSGSLSGAGVTTTNDTCIFGGVPGSFQPFAREGDPAPGTVGATFGSSFSNISHQPTGCNENGLILFQSATLGGDTVTSPISNNAAWFTGFPGALQLMQRKGDVVLGGAVISALGFVSQMNPSGQVLHDETLSTTLGLVPATAANDRTLWIYTPGVGNQLVVREGDVAPGTSGGIFGLPSNSWFVNVGPNCFNASGNTVIAADLSGGDCVTGINDRGLFWGGVGGLVMAQRRGDPAPGIAGATFEVVSNSSVCLNDNDFIAFEASVLGGGTTATNDTGIWMGLPGNLAKIMQEGDPAPGTVGAVFGNQTGLFMIMNDKNQLIFNADLVGGDVVPATGNNSAVYAYDPIVGLQLVARRGDTVVLPSGALRTISSVGGGNQFNNGDAAPLSFNHNGECVVNLGFDTASGGGGAVVAIRVGSISGIPHDISVSTGGLHTMYLDAGAANANNIYVVLGSISGSTPGFAYNQFLVPLNQDFYFLYTQQFPNIPPLFNTLGTLDADGRQIAAFQMPLGYPQLAGMVLTHAFAAVNPGSGQVTFVSDAQDMLLVP